ncbi:unnamed protein product [Rotaria socialis]|uniref:Uncharacterized protein n=1 Tax=Rotaria socialis TaxID=392032 RepID=A0A821AUC1_9BILA|nr:unnamed protein product [Rotaria socialis]
MQHELSDQLQQFDEKGQLIHLNYLYEYGARCQFNEQFHRIWSEYFNQHPNLSIQKYEFSVKQENNDQRQLPSIQVDKDIYIPGKNPEGNHELQKQAAEKEQHKTTLSVETKGTLSSYDADPYLKDNNPMNNMMILGSPLSQPLNFDTIE